MGKAFEPPTFFSYGFKFSLLLHFVVLLWLIAQWAAGSYVSKEDMKKLRPKKAIRVDIVDLPSIKFNELNKVDLTKEVSKETKPVSKEEAKTEPAPPPPSPTAMKLPSDKKEKNIPDKKRLEEIQKSIRAEAKRQEIMSKFKQEVKKGEDDKRPLLGGNIISKGGSVQGDIANEADEFTALVQTHVRKFWKAPPWSAGQNYKVRVVVKLSPAGRVLSKLISKSSGRPEFDASALEAVEAADPFPPPPDFYKRIVLQEGIECGFPE